jgi:hypothetical protein
MTIWRMRNACWIPTATNTNSDYVTYIALPHKQLSRERPPALRHMYTVCPVDFQNTVDVFHGTVTYPEIIFGGGWGVQQIQLRTEGRENGDLGTVAP